MEIKVPKWALLALGALLLVGIGAGVAIAVGGGGDTSTSVATVTTSASATSSEQTTTEDTTPSESTSSEPGSCDDLGINGQELNTGTCMDGKQEIVLVNRDGTVKMDQMNAHLVDISTTETMEGRSFGPKDAKGVFVVVKLAVTNTTSTPQTFDSQGDSVEVVLCNDIYTEDFNVENGAATDSFVWKSNEVQPNTTATGLAVFDVPADRASCIEKNGNVDFGQFRDDISFGRWKQIGVIRTYH